MTARREPGIALVEVMLAVALLGIVLSTMAQVVSAATRGQSRLHERSVEERLLETALVAIRAKHQTDVPAELAGEMAEPFDDYAWHARITPGQGDLPLACVVISLTKGGEHVTTLRTFL